MSREVKLLNEPRDCVKEAVEGILLSTSNIIALENENVLFRSDLATVNTREVTLLLEVDLDMNLLMQDTSEMVIASPPYSLTFP
jgi:hypothetical protein